MKKKFYKFLFISTTATVLTWLYLTMPGVFFSLDGRLRDFMFLMRGKVQESHKVVIVDIDEASLRKYGQWPWSRNIISTMLLNLRDAQAGVIGLDIVFAEKDKSSPKTLERFCTTSISLPDYDAMLAKTFSNTPVIGGYIFSFDTKEAADAPNIPAVFIKKGFSKQDHLIKPTGVIKNIKTLQDALYSSGFFNNIPDEGGMIRSVPLIMEYHDSIYPSLALEMFRIYTQNNRVDIIGDVSGVKYIQIGGSKISTDMSGRLIVNFRGPRKTFEYISAKDVIENSFDQKKVAGKFILVGTSAVGLSDMRSTPFDNTIAGVEVHANAIDNLLQGDFLQKPSETLLYNIALIWIITILTTILFSLISSRLIFPLTLVLAYLLYALYYTILFDYGYVLNILFPLLAFIISLIGSVAIDYFFEAKQKEKAQQLLGKKVSQKVMNYLVTHADEELVSSREVEATVFFSDIRSFTTISETIGSPDKVIHMLNSYMTPMVENIIEHEGTIDKFIGDAIMAYWNAPVIVSNHADKAVSSAIEQIKMLKTVNETIQPQYGVSINIGIGINTGVVTAGDMGSKGRSDYTIIGDNVNLASRMEGLTKEYGIHILISLATKQKLKGEYTIRPIDIVEVKGKNEAVEIFEVICDSNIRQDELLQYSEGIESFRNADIEQALNIFTALANAHPSKLYEHYIQRCKYFLENPQIEFTPILKMTTK